MSLWESPRSYWLWAWTFLSQFDAVLVVQAVVVQHVLVSLFLSAAPPPIFKGWGGRRFMRPVNV